MPCDHSRLQLVYSSIIDCTGASAQELQEVEAFCRQVKDKVTKNNTYIMLCHYGTHILNYNLEG